MKVSPYPKPVKRSEFLIAAVAVSALLASCGQAGFNGGSPSKPAPKEEQLRDPQTPAPPPNQLPGPIGDQITDTEVHFGDDKVFHIGDNQYPASSCKDQIDTYKLSGNRYYFQFQVTEPGTVVDISVNKICGVDYSRSNIAYLQANRRVFESRPLAVSGERLQLSGVTLDPGTYALVVESRRDYSRVRGGDNDDFLVGQISIKASKKIVGGFVRTE
jgi:hypothetical protein